MWDRWSFVACSMLCLSWSLLAPARLSAQEADTDQRARALFLGGQAHYDAGQFAEAADEFEESYRLSQRPQLLYNIFVARRDAGQRAEAADALRRYLELAPDAENAASLRARLAVLEQELAASADASATDDAADAPEQATTPPPSAAPDGGPSPIGWIVGGVGAASLVASVVTGVLALDAHGSLDAACGPSHDACPADLDARVSNGRALTAATDGLLIGGGLALATGVVLLFVLREPTSDESPPVSASCGPSGCALTVQGAF